MKVLSCWQLADVYASITIAAPEGSAALAVTASVAPGRDGGWCVEWRTTSLDYIDSAPLHRVYRHRDAAAWRALSALREELRTLSTPVLARAS